MTFKFSVFSAAALILLASGCSDRSSSPAPGAKALTDSDAHASAPSPWLLKRSKDELTDKQRLAAVALGPDDSAVIVLCEGRRLDAAIGMKSLFSFSDTVVVTYRFDDAPAVSKVWSVASGGKSLFPDPNETAAFVRQIGKSQRLIFEAVAPRDLPYRTTFAIGGGESQIKDVLAECGLAATSLADSYPGLRKEISDTLETLGPEDVLALKEGLAERTLYKGEINLELNKEFAFATQAFVDEYRQSCERKRKGLTVQARGGAICVGIQETGTEMPPLVLLLDGGNGVLRGKSKARAPKASS